MSTQWNDFESPEPTDSASAPDTPKYRTKIRAQVAADKSCTDLPNAIHTPFNKDLVGGQAWTNGDLQGKSKNSSSDLCQTACDNTSGLSSRQNMPSDRGQALIYMEQLVSLDLRLREIKATDAEMKDTVKELVTQTQQAESRVAKARSKLSAKRKRATEMKILRDEVHQLIGIPSLLREDKLKDRCRLYEAVKEMQAVDEEAHNEDTSVYQKEISDAEAVLSPLKIRITKGKSARKQLQAEQQREEEKFEQLWKALYSC